ARPRITALQHGVEVAMVGVVIGENDGPQLRGELGLLGTANCVAVLASGLPERMRPPAVRERLEPSLAQASALSGGLVVGLVIAQVLDLYEELLEAVEHEAVRIAEEVFVSRGGDQLKRSHALSRPVHAAAMAVQPLLHGLDELGPSVGPSLTKQLRSKVIYLSGHLGRLDALLSSAQQSYFSLAQDDANRLIEQQANVTRKLSGYALLIAIPTIVFSLYGTNFHH